MRWKSHLIFGLFFGLIWISVFGVSDKWYFIGFVLFASLLPDIDHPQSKVGRRVKPLSWLINNIFGHRGIFHSIWPVVVLYIVLVYLLGWKLAGIGLCVGFMSHLISDALTLDGVNFGHPFRAKVSGFIRTGGASEWVFFFAVSVLCFLKINILF